MKSKMCFSSHLIFVINIILAILFVANLYYTGVFRDTHPEISIPGFMGFLSWILPVITVCMLPVTAVNRNKPFSKPLAIIFITIIAVACIYILRGILIVV